MAKKKEKRENKEKITSIRLTKTQYEAIIRLYGSVQKFFDTMAKVLPLIALMALNSCSSVTGNIDTGCDELLTSVNKCVTID
jgi:hypothetical protein